MVKKNSGNINSRITFFGFMLSVLVVYLHTKNVDWYGLLENKSVFSEIVKGFQWFISDNIAQCAVPGFFMLSGCLFYKNFTMADYKNKMISRIHSLFIPYVCFNILRLIYAFFIRNILTAGGEQVVLSFRTILESIFLFKYNQGYWYMFQLILYVVLCPAVYVLIKNKRAGAICVLCLFIINMFDKFVMSVPVILLNSFFYYLLGAYLGRHFFEQIKKSPKHPLCFFIVGVVLSQISMYLFLKLNLIFFHFMFCLFLVVSLFVVTSLYKKTIVPSWMSLSFFIYSMHGTILEVSQKLLFYVLPRNPVFALAEYIVLPVISIFIIVLTAFFLKKKIPFIWKLLNGGR